MSNRATEQPTSGDVDVGFVPRYRLSCEGFEDEGTNFVRLVVQKQPRVDPRHERVLLQDQSTNTNLTCSSAVIILSI